MIYKLGFRRDSPGHWPELLQLTQIFTLFLI